MSTDTQGAPGGTLDADRAKIDGTISATVRSLQAAYHVSPYALAARLGISYETLHRRLRGARGGWTAAEVYVLAQFFRVSIDDIYSGLGGRLSAAVAEVSNLGSEGWGFESLRARSAGNVADVLVLDDYRPTAPQLALVVGLG